MTEEAEAGVVLAMMVSPARLAVVARVREQSDIRVHWPVGRWTRRRRPSLCRQYRRWKSRVGPGTVFHLFLFFLNDYFHLFFYYALPFTTYHSYPTDFC